MAPRRPPMRCPAPSWRRPPPSSRQPRACPPAWAWLAGAKPVLQGVMQTYTLDGLTPSFPAIPPMQATGLEGPLANATNIVIDADATMSYAVAGNGTHTLRIRGADRPEPGPP